jgi:hypothetical protein
MTPLEFMQRRAALVLSIGEPNRCGRRIKARAHGPDRICAIVAGLERSQPSGCVALGLLSTGPIQALLDACK